MADRIAVVLFQLSGPDSTEAVEPFLYNLFMDPDIIDFPLAFLARKPLARFISRKRSVKVAENYRLIGGKSPILDLTRRQSDALERRLRESGMDATTFIAMRYWHPFTKTVVREIRNGGFTRIILLPLYPQFSRATTLSSMNEWDRECERQGLRIPTQYVCCYPAGEGYVGALVENINALLERFRGVDPASIDLLFSAHGVPVSYIAKGDPYQMQMEYTVRQVMAAGGWTSPHRLCFQSRVGPMKWLQPSLVETVHQLAATGRKNLAVIPVAFVTDHIETLHEINIDVRREAMALGVERFELMPALNDHPKYVDGLAGLVTDLVRGEDPVRTCSLLWGADTDRPRLRLCPRIPR